jgi:hypothetical protein
VIAMLVPAVAAHASGPRVEIDAPEYDAGKVDQGTVVRHVFALENTGDADLHVAAVPGCSCTVVALDEVVKPGASGTIAATLDTREQQGRIAKVVRVTTNDARRATFELRLLADVVPAFRLSPSAFPVIAGTRDELRPATVALESTNGAPFDVVGVAAEPTLTANVERAGPSRYVLTITAKPSAPAGRSRPIVTVTTSHPNVPTVTVHVNLDVRSHVEVEPKRLRRWTPPSSSR